MRNDLLSQTISAAEFKTHCLKIMAEVQQKKKNILITKKGIPVAQLIPTERNALSLFGWMQGDLEVCEDILEPLSIEWEADKS